MCEIGGGGRGGALGCFSLHLDLNKKKMKINDKEWTMTSISFSRELE